PSTVTAKGTFSQTETVAGAEIVSIVGSFASTVIVNSQTDALPALSAATQLTMVSPTGNTVPEQTSTGGSATGQHVTATSLHESLTGTSNSTAAPPASAHVTTIGAGQVITGGV